jgi:hypothetical protein
MDWRAGYRRGFSAGALTLFLGPAFGGVTYGIMGDVGHFILLAKGQLPGPSATLAEQFLLVFLVPATFASAAYLIPAAWLAAAAASLYVAVRVGATGQMTWVETVSLAVACGMLACFIYQKEFWSISSFYLLISVFGAALALRYLAGRWRLA